MIDRPSPNHGPRPEATPIDLIVLHYTGMPGGAEALDRLCDPAAEVSAHYLIEEDGRLFRLVAEERRAWHAGVACWGGECDVNSRSIGIELVNPGHEFGYRDFPEAQIAALLALLADIRSRHRIPKHRLVGHSDVAPQRKQDPGELFPWQRLAEAGFGLWPDARQSAFDLQPDHAATQRLLRRFGYDIPTDGREDAQDRAVIRAFHRRFRPEALDAPADLDTYRLIDSLVRQAGL